LNAFKPKIQIISNLNLFKKGQKMRQNNEEKKENRERD
jgi:hypothetical protein